MTTAAHGTRSRYVNQRCRCAPCRAANSAATQKRKEELRQLRAELPPSGPPIQRGARFYCPGANGNACVRPHAPAELRGGRAICDACVAHVRRLVPADGVRDHLRRLRKTGVGLQAMHDASGVAVSQLLCILRDRRSVHTGTAQRLLALDEWTRADGALAPRRDAARMRQRLAALKRLGFRDREINRLLGLKGDAIQFGRSRRVTVRRAASIERLWKRVLRGEVKPAPPRFVPAAPVFAIVDRLVEEGWLSRAAMTRRLGFNPFQCRHERIRRERAEAVVALEERLRRERDEAIERREREQDRIRFGLARNAA